MCLDNGDIKPLVSHQQERVLSLPSLESVEWQRRETRVSRFVASPGTHDICDMTSLSLREIRDCSKSVFSLTI